MYFTIPYTHKNDQTVHSVSQSDQLSLLCLHRINTVKAGAQYFTIFDNKMWQLIFLCVTEGSDEILGRVKRDHARSVREQIYHMLLEWKKMNASEATLNVIIKELEDLNENLLASVYRRKLSHIVYP